MRRFMKLPSPPMVVACVALLLGLTGTGYAALKLPRNSVTTVQVKDGTLLARDFKTGQLPASGGAAAGATVRWVEVLASGAIVAQSGGITVRHVGNGYYVVDFGVDVGGKAILASSARTGDDRTAAASSRPVLHDVQPDGDNCVTGNDARFVGVYTYDGPGSQPENHSFYVAVIG